MLLVWLGIYTAIMACVWAFFLVAKIHVYKFRDYSRDIVVITRWLMLFLILATSVGYFLVIDWTRKGPTVIPSSNTKQVVEDVSNY